MQTTPQGAGDRVGAGERTPSELRQGLLVLALAGTSVAAIGAVAAHALNLAAAL